MEIRSPLDERGTSRAGFGYQSPTRKQFLANMEAKLKDNEFITDMYAIIRPGISYRIEEAWEFVREILVENI